MEQKEMKFKEIPKDDFETFVQEHDVFRVEERVHRNVIFVWYSDEPNWEEVNWQR